MLFVLCQSAENDVDIVLTQVKVIIGFLKNKDKYENVYEQMIKSLLINKSDNNDGLRIVTPNLKVIMVFQLTLWQIQIK